MTVNLELDDEATHPLYHQIYRQIRELILAGELPAGHRLPSGRALARQHGVARVTVTRAYNQLAAEGYVQRERGSGTFVMEEVRPVSQREMAPFRPSLTPWGKRVLRLGNARDERGAEPSRHDIDFGFGRSFPHIFPYDVWRRLLARYLSTDDTMLSRYGTVAGFWPLREAIADYVRRLRGVRCTAAQVVVVHGAQQALDLLARLLLQESSEVLVETPGYTDAYAIFQVHGAQLTALPVDEEGFPVEAVPQDSQAKLAFVTPAHQFPRGGAMPLTRRLALLRWARRHGALVVEDDYDSALRYEGQPLAALQGLDDDGRVIYLGSFSKVLFPALRLGYVILPHTLLAPFVEAKAIVDRGAPTLTQAAVADFIRDGHFERHLRRLRNAYGGRRQLLVDALQRALPGPIRFSREPAGLHVMIYLPPGCDERRVVAAAAAEGIGVYPGAAYHLEPEPPPSILLGFSGLGPEEIETGVRRLGHVLVEELQRST